MHTRRRMAQRKPLQLHDFLFIAPYNAQVRALRRALPKGARVGSVDKFQGQEAAVCILSMCSSYGEYGSRGLRFILDRSRINVAISRAKCLAIVVGDPRIATSPAGSIGEMKLLNLYCKMASQSQNDFIMHCRPLFLASHRKSPVSLQSHEWPTANRSTQTDSPQLVLNRSSGIFFRQSRRRGKFSRTENRTAKCLPERERENFQPRRFCFGIFLSATRSRIVRRNFSRSAGVSASSLRFIASATVLA